MKKRNFLAGGILLLTMGFGMAGCTIGGDDKRNEIVSDPLQTEKEYYIIGTVSHNGGPVSATVTVDGSISTQTDSKGAFSLTVESASAKYTLRVEANGYEPYEVTGLAFSSQENRSQLIVNIAMAKKLSTESAQKVTVETGQATDATITAPNIEDSSAKDATITIPAGGVSGTTDISAVVYEEAKILQSTIPSPGTTTATASVSNVYVETDPAGITATEDFTIAIPNPDKTTDHLDTNYLTAEKSSNTRAGENFPVVFNNGKYDITVPSGTVIAGKYQLKVDFLKTVVNGEDVYNTVNEVEGVVRIENREYNARDTKLRVKAKYGWEYIITPATALSNVGASEELGDLLNKYIIQLEGQTMYTITKELTATISGNYVLYFGSKAKVQERTYTFRISVGGVSKEVDVKIRCYVGQTEEYINAPISQHSGGGTNIGI